ncbi:MAG: hypothetical protein HZB18_12025 [Chloroflexi bacterium]|nr:hypothetical protein [Chloroflexota bacterium]
MPKTKRTKMDKAIVIALIGLAGTVIAALIASPVIGVWLAKTPAAETANTSSQTKELVFDNDFENGEVTGFYISNDNWQVIKDGGNSVLEISGTASGNTTASFGSNVFSDGVIEFRIKFKNFDGFILTFRSSNGQTYTLYLAPADGEVKLGYGSAAKDWNLEPFQNGVSLLNFSEDVWYDVKLEALNDQMTLWVGGNKTLSSQDSRLRQGGLEFAVQYDGTVFLDNVKVYEFVH